MRKATLYLAVFVLLLLLPVGARYFQYYRPFAPRPAAPPAYSAAGIAAVPTPAAGETSVEVDAVEPVRAGGSADVAAVEATRAAVEATRGIAVLDQAHRNQFTAEELATLDGLLAARGFQVQPVTEGDLAAALRPAGALIVIAPVDDYSAADVRAVSEFVARGGRVLLVGDPTRYHVEFDEEDIFAPPVVETAQTPLNALANPFDITFRGDYLYNTVENEGNFRNILLGEAGLAGGPLTDGLSRLALYSSHSLLLGPSAAPLLSADDNTWSSATDRPGGLTLAALSPPGSDGGQVLALGDVHFLTEPYITVHDNAAFAGRVADFLAGGTRNAGVLAGFPYFYDSPVDLVYSEAPELGPDAFDEIITLQAAFREAGLSLALAGEPAGDHDALYLGLYNQAGDVAELLEVAGVELVITPAISAPGDETDEEAGAPAGTRLIRSALGDVQMAGTALILLGGDEARRQVAVLAASNDGLESAVDRLRAGDLSGCLQQDTLALCPTGVAGEPVEYALDTSGPADAPADPQPEGEPPAGDDDNRPGGEQAPAADVVDQGPIALGETQSAELAADEAHAWTFNGGPATIDIVVDAGQNVDAVLELYAPDDTLVGNVDSTFAGGQEEMRGVEIADDGDYTIVVRDFFNDGGDYELSVTAGETGGGEEAGLNRIFIFADDDGEALTDGFTSAPLLADLLEGDYDVTIWLASDDGPLPDDALQGIDLLIWESGDYRDEGGPVSDDVGVIVDYLNGGGNLFVSGLSPTILGAVDVAPLAAAAVVDGDPTLSRGFEEGQIIEFDATYRVALPNATDVGANEFVFLERAPGEEGEGAVIGIGGVDADNGQRTIFLLAPLAGLPDEARGQLVANIMAWFEAT
ncbi:DUF4350 domain-containing protein [Promineifilum sp.]|uniref:DUF4350 domain-containing protein n=1 Tax=Promineifilum sp. TaxID=2664178 RepID=UPI0035B31304